MIRYKYCSLAMAIGFLVTAKASAQNASPPATAQPALPAPARGAPPAQEPVPSLPTLLQPPRVNDAPAPADAPPALAPDGQLPAPFTSGPKNGNGDGAAAASVLSDSGRGNMGIEGIAMGEGMNPRPRVGYTFTWYPDESVGAQGRTLGIFRQDLQASTPIYRDDHDALTFSVGVRNEILDTNANLPILGTSFPDDLWNVHFGGGYVHEFANRWTAGLNVQVGSASDEPFANVNQITVGATGSLRIPVRERDAWIFTVNYSNNSDFANNIPIPGVAYLWWPSDTFRALIGVPFAHLWWEPVDRLTIDLSYRILYTVTGRIAYRFAPRLKAYAGYSLGNESFYLVENPQDDNRLFYSEQRVYGGIGWLVADRLSLDLTSGFAFDRFYSVGQNFQQNQSLKLPVGDGPYISLALQWRF